VRDNKLIELIDAFCDAVPRRRAGAEEYGPLVLFVPAGPGFPYYARPRRGQRPPVTAAGIRAVRARQRELIIPESFEWIEQVAGEMAAAAAEAGLEVHRHPLMVLTKLTPPPALPPGITVRVVAPDDPELDRIWAVPAVAFGHPGTAAGDAGPAERDKIAADYDGGTIAMLRERLRSGQSVVAAAFGQDGPLAAGSCQSLDGVAEITGVGVLPARRRQGLGAAVTAALAADAVERGVRTVFLSASDAAVARIYASIGFGEIGTAMIAEPPSALCPVMRPQGVAAAEADRLVKGRCPGLDADRGAERARLSWLGHGRHEREELHAGRGARLVAAVRLAQGAGEVPAVDHELVQPGLPRDLSRQRHPAHLGDALPGLRRRPGLGHGHQPSGELAAPVPVEGRRGRRGVLQRRPRLGPRVTEGDGQRHGVPEQVPHGVIPARRARPEHVVGHALGQRHQPPGRRSKVQPGGHRQILPSFAFHRQCRFAS
jgi:ribosomal protein S18 acetylase RimI-like enzyme